MKFQKILTTTTLFFFVFSYFFIFSYDYSLGQSSITNNFFVEEDFDFVGRQKISSNLRYESANAYFYVDDTSYGGLSGAKKLQFNDAIIALANEFDTKIYPTLRNIYGSEWNPGIDNDAKITILISKMLPGVKGYFLERNEVFRSVNEFSNEREMLYLNSETVLKGDAKIHLAHEFVHLIEYNERTRLRAPQKKWLSEGLADYAPTLLGYNSAYKNSYLENRVEDFLSFSGSSLTNWNNTPIDFATSSMFMHYLVGQYGNRAITEIMRASIIGEGGVTQALSAMGSNESFGDLFTNWTIANYINSIGKYSYKTPNLNFSNLHISTPLQYSIFSNSEITTNFFVEYSSAAWLKFVPGQLGVKDRNILKVQFDSSQSLGNFSVPYVVTDIFGRNEVRFMDLDSNKGTMYVENFGTQVIAVVVAPSNYYQSNSPKPSAGSFTIKVSMADNIRDGEVKGYISYADGALLRANGTEKVYVIKKGVNGELYKRWIPSAEVFNGYGHLKWQDIIDVPASDLAKYNESRLVKFIGDYKVYELTQDGKTKQWLNITASQFETSNRSWNAIYEVNQKEYNFYTTGTDKNS